MAATGNNGNGKLMRAFFSPAVALMSRLNIARKFTLLGLMSLAAIAVVVYSLFSSLNQVISFSQRELQGFELIGPLPRVAQTLQQHRGLSAGLISGDKTMRGNLISVSSEVGKAFEAMEAKLPPDLASGEALRHIRADWAHLREAGLAWTKDENMAVHTLLIGRVQTFEAMVADEYSLILDPEINTYYLINTIVNKLPHALEHLGQLRAYGTGILAEKRALPYKPSQLLPQNTLNRRKVRASNQARRRLPTSQ